MQGHIDSCRPMYESVYQQDKSTVSQAERWLMNRELFQELKPA